VAKFIKRISYGALFLILVLACNFGSDVVENSNSENNNSSDLATTPLPAALSLTITNRSSRTVCGLYATLQEATEWGEERLGTEVLDTGETFGLDLADGNYRIRASDCDSDLIAEYNDFEVSGPTTLTIEDRIIESSLSPGGGAGILTVVNNASVDVCYVFVSATDATTWGNDWLGESTILDSGATETITVDAGLWDLQAADCDGNAIAEQYDVDLNTGQTWTLGQ
jgi:hypothetical protein